MEEKQRKYNREYMMRRYNTDEKFRKKMIDSIKKYQKKNKTKIKEYQYNYNRSDRFKEINKKRYIKNRVNPEWIVNERLRIYSIKVLKKVNNLRARRFIDKKKIVDSLKPIPENISDYEIDHKIPLSKFDLSDDKQVKKAFRPENHQLVPKWYNQFKRDKTEKELLESIRESEISLNNMG